MLIIGLMEIQLFVSKFDIFSGIFRPLSCSVSKILVLASLEEKLQQIKIAD